MDVDVGVWFRDTQKQEIIDKTAGEHGRTASEQKKNIYKRDPGLGGSKKRLRFGKK